MQVFGLINGKEVLRMTNEEFQKAVLGELKGIKGEIGGIKGEIGGIKGEIGEIKVRLTNVEAGQDEIKVKLTNVETRQDEIYQVVRAIEHSNQVGKSELDSHNIRLAKVEGKLKKVAKAYNDEEEIDKAANL